MTGFLVSSDLRPCRQPRAGGLGLFIRLGAHEKDTTFCGRIDLISKVKGVYLPVIEPSVRMGGMTQANQRQGINPSVSSTGRANSFSLP